MLDPYGDLSSHASIPKTPGSYALIGPGGFTGTLPAEVTPIAIPLNFSALIFRADKFSPTGENQIAQADAFRRSLTSQTLSDYLENPSGGAAKIVPEILFAVPFKTTADNLIAHDPIAFLTQLQRAVESGNTPAFSPYEQALSDRFNSLFANRSANESEFSDGAQAAHELILDRYLTHTHWAALLRQTGSISPISVTGATRSSNDRRSRNSSSTPMTSTRQRIITYSRIPMASRSTGATRGAMS